MNGWTVGILIVISLLTVAGAIAVTQMQSFAVAEVPSPGDWVSEEQIRVYQDHVILDLPNSTWATFTNTNSMDPFLDENSHAIEITPSSAAAISVGDIVSYTNGTTIRIHRVVRKGEDEQGPYFFVKGDNNQFPDQQKVRFDEIHGVVVAVIY